MSRYMLPGKEPRHRLIVGVDAVLPLPSLYAHVIDLAWETDGRVIDEKAEAGDSPEEGLLLWLGGGVPPLREMHTLVSGLAHYGEIPVELQIKLVEELDRIAPYSISGLGSQLAGICQQVPGARLTVEPATERVVLLLNEHGWQTQPWQEIAHAPDYLIAQLLFPTQTRVPIDPLSGYTSDHSIIFRIHANGMNLQLPVFTIFARGVALCGPVAIAKETNGLTAQQVELIQQEVFFVPPSLQAIVSTLWYRAWATGAQREW